MTLEVAIATDSPKRVKDLFAVMIATCKHSKSVTLGEKYQEALSEDILHQMRLAHPELELNSQTANLALSKIEDSDKHGSKRFQQLGFCQSEA